MGARITRGELVVRLVWPLVWGVAVCALFFGAVSAFTRFTGDGLAWWGWLLVIALFAGIEWGVRLAAHRTHPSVFGVDLFAPELSGERFAGVIVTLIVVGLLSRLSS